MTEAEVSSKAALDFHEVLAVIPTLGTNMSRLHKAIDSVREQSARHNIHIVVVDNSKNGDVGHLDSVDEILRFGLNLGWVGALEVVRRRYNFKYLWTIQDDMVLLNDALSYLKSDLDTNPELGVSSPIISRNGLIPAGSSGATFENKASLTFSPIPRIDTPIANFQNPPDLCCVWGRGALWRGSALSDLGGFSLNLFPLSSVDKDMCLRLVKNDWKVRVSTQAHVDHEGRGSTPSLLSEVVWWQHPKLVRDNLEGKERESETKTLPLDHDVLFAIASKSSYLLLDVSKLGSEQILLWKSRPIFQKLLSTKLASRLHSGLLRLENSQSVQLSRAARLVESTLRKVLRVKTLKV
jgi:GT2 family glycosyltransferase